MAHAPSSATASAHGSWHVGYGRAGTDDSRHAAGGVPAVFRLCDKILTAAAAVPYSGLLRIDSVADLLLPLHEAEVTDEVREPAVFVTTVKLADDFPAATVTL